ncbi:MAG: site-specific recombinase [Steroidobacteraceae bacterium]|nr:site-specific recombinase [Steroidobacteraceae bacterium]
MSLPADLDRVRDFERLLEELHAGGVPDSGEWLARVADVLRPASRGNVESAQSHFRTLLHMLESRPEYAAALNAHVRRLLESRMHRILYADSGVPGAQGFFGSLARRVLGRLLPPAVDTEFLRDLVAEVFDRPRDYVWLRSIPHEDWNALLHAIDVDGAEFAPARRKCRHELLEAMRLDSYRLAALGTETALLQYLPALARHESPFLAQNDEVRGFIERHADPSCASEHDGHLEVLLGQCEDYVDRIRRRSREAGVSVDLVFLLARIEQAITRLRQLRDLALPAAEGAPSPVGTARGRVIDFFLTLVRQENRRNSVRDLFRGTTELLARRITEQASRSGEHYITASRGEFVAMYRAAAGAGFIIAVMALLKLKLAQLDLPLLWEGAAFSLNYGLGFMLIHILHLTIATKQPAMTAATLAGALDGRDNRETRLDALADLAAEVSRTQWISIAGNVSITMLTAFAIALTAVQFFGWQAAGTEKAAHLLHDLHPWHSLALLHAAIAGVFLFLSGLISGYYDNQALYHRIPQRLRRLKWLRAALGEERLGRLAAYTERNLGALAGNFLFGCMLGVTPILGELLGLPFDIRHVAFASANFAYGLVGLQFAVTPATVVISVAGVLLIGLTNLIVSFSLALRVALRSRGITPEQTDGLWGRVLQRFLARPRDFFWPPATAVV